MRIWLLEDGERTGPHEIYTIRDRISNGEVEADTQAWYDGADGWGPLGEVPAYASYFKKPSSEESLEGAEKLTSEFVESAEKDLESDGHAPRSQPDSAVFSNEPLHPVRRFFARMLDFSLYNVLLYIVMLKLGLDLQDLGNPTKGLLLQIPYLILDGLALSYFGTTPGKRLLNIKLRRYDGYHLEISSSIIRSLRVWVMGFAMGSILLPIAIAFSWFVASKYGKFLWDIPRNNITECKPLTPLNIIGYIGVLLAANYLLQAIVPPELLPSLDGLKAIFDS